MKSDDEILDDFLETDDFYKQLTIPQQVVYRIEIKNTLAFAVYEMRVRFNDFIDNLSRDLSKIWRDKR